MGSQRREQASYQHSSASLAGSAGGDFGISAAPPERRSFQASGAEEQSLFLVFRIANLPEIRAAWGAGRARRVCRIVVDRLADIVGAGGMVQLDRADHIKAVISGAAGLPLHRCAAFVRAFCDQIILNPIKIDDAVIHVALDGDWHAGSPAEGQSPAGAMCEADWLNGTGDRARFGRSNDAVLIGGPAWAERFHADMSQAVELFRRLSQDEISLAWQPVRKLPGAAGGGGILYLESMLRGLSDETDGFFSRAIEALERVGLARSFDRFIVQRVLDRLCLDGNLVLGVNISAQSACLGGWWDDVLAEFRATPGLANRLVVEITETANFPSVSAAVEFVDVLRRQGCLIALDDFGVGNASFRQLFVLGPDIVKIDAMFLRRAEQPAGCALLHHLIGVARAMTPIVVVEGVETEADSRLIDEIGGGDCWQQGHFLGRPSLVCTWETSSDDPRLGALRQFRDACMAPGSLQASAA